MNLQSLKHAAENAIKVAENSKVATAETAFVRLIVPRWTPEAERIKIANGLSGYVVSSQAEPPETLCTVNAKKLLAWLETEKV